MSPLTTSDTDRRAILLAAHYQWWGEQVQDALDKQFGGRGKVPPPIQQAAFDLSAAGFMAGYSLGYEAARKELGGEPAP